MSDRPFLEDATKLFELINELRIKETAIYEIEIVLARTFTAAYREGYDERKNEGISK